MKKVIVAALLVVGLTTFAQEKGGRKALRENLTTEQKVDLQVNKLSKDLNLTDVQKKSVQELVTKQVKNREVKRAEMKANKDQERADFRAEMQKEQAATSANMKKILTPEQFSQWEKIRDKRKENFKEKMVERKQKDKGRNFLKVNKNKFCV